MKIRLKTRGVVINLLISVVISLIANFSYFVMMITSSNTPERMHPRHAYIENPTLVTIEVMYYIILAFILLTIFTANLDESKIDKGSFWKRLLICLGVAAALYFFAPYPRRNGEIILQLSARKLFNPMLVLKCSFTFVVAALYGKIYELIYQKQTISVENEKLKTENIQSRYDVLINQINPHFFFNSLNSLSMLVRENKNADALTYIDRLSDTFRYVIETGRRSMTTLAEELEFAEAYKYLFEVRYEGKFFIDINVDGKYDGYILPSLSLQPLIENAVKHNTITRNTPLHITISAGDGYLTVSNPVTPKIGCTEEGTGIGLKNISSRYLLLTGKDIVIVNDGKTFTVKLPLIDNREKGLQT